MSWNEPGKNNKNPWGGGGKNQGPPDLDEIFRKFQEKFSQVLGGGGGGRSSGTKGNAGGDGKSGGYKLILGAGLIMFVAFYIFNAIYIVEEKERAVVFRFGSYLNTVEPGLHFYMPPIDKKYQEIVTELRTYQVSQEMLTEDENIVEVSLSVQYNIGDLKDYVLKVQNPDKALQEATQSALRHVVGSSDMHSVLTEGRAVLGDEVKERLQNYLNNYGAGLFISKVNVERAQPPRQVQASFDDVIRAREDEERAKNDAESYANKVVPEARGTAQRILEEASGYKEEVISKAEGEAFRFIKVVNEYKKYPKVTRDRLYIDMMESVLSSTSKVLVDVEGGNNMMYIPLDKLMDRQQSGGAKGSKHDVSINDADVSPELMERIADRVVNELSRRTNSNDARSGRIVR